MPDVEDLQRVRDELDALCAGRLRTRLNSEQHARYRALVTREAELLGGHGGSRDGS